jgi:ABC-type multidrug transport system permease subunit
VKAAARKSNEPTFVRGFWAQLAALLHRNWLTYYRSPEFSLNRIAVVMMFTGLFAGFFFHSKMETVGDVEGRIVLIFFFSSLSALYSLYTLVPFAMSRRALYYRERAAFTYSVATYNWAEGLVEIPYIVIQIVLTVPILYYITNMPYDSWERPIYFTLMILMILLLMTSMAFFMASLFSDPLAAQLASIGALLTLMVFCGIMVPRQSLPAPYVPMYYFSFFKYSSEGLLTTQFHNLQANICVPAGRPVEKGILHRFPICTYDGSSNLSQISGIQIEAADFVLNDFAKDYKYDNRWFDIAVLATWIVGLRLFTYVITLYVNHNRR